MARSGNPADLVARNLEALRGALEQSVTVQTSRLHDLVDDLVARGSLSRAEADNLVSQLLSASRAYSQTLLQVLDGITATATAPVRATAGRIAETVSQTVRSAPIRVPGRRASTGRALPDLSTLTVAQAKEQLDGLDAADLRRLREQEVAGKSRKGVLDEIARRLG
ncbi:hypothetical protein L615_003300000180 [Nocardioides sp. J9]|uniref:hypothetical protein n=1 Tax=unclassified Nocardioides TaxID=2615069 RepID=UPI000490B51F|nr:MULTISPECIES: hypothetical protein [unclassified Nocardioides]TWG97825.1 hypothetical protein L615_003300000180 [Nocardioides sp. J9]